MSDGEWYWCLVHHAVEPYHGCRAEDRLGPYASPEDAANALQHLRDQNERWDREDEDD